MAFSGLILLPVLLVGMLTTYALCPAALHVMPMALLLMMFVGVRVD